MNGHVLNARRYLTTTFTMMMMTFFYAVLDCEHSVNITRMNLDDKLIFNPFVTEDCGDTVPLGINDPDLNYFNEVSQIGTCKYSLEDTFKQEIIRNDCENNDFSIFHLNIRSAPKKLGRLITYLDVLSFNFTVLGLTETWFTEHNKNLYNIKGYSIENRIRQNKLGASLLIQSNIEYTSRDDLNDLYVEPEMLFIEIDVIMLLLVLFTVLQILT